MAHAVAAARAAEDVQGEGALHELARPTSSGAKRALEVADDLWEWPQVLDPGLEIGGQVAFTAGTEALEATRSYVVGERETVTVTAGEYDAQRVAFTETPSIGDVTTETVGTLWLAPGGGLVRSEWTHSEASSRLELITVVDQR